MKLKQKFVALACICGLLMAVISCAGYYSAHTSLHESVEGELLGEVRETAFRLSKWIEPKAAMTQAVADVLTAAGGTVEALATQSNLAAGKDDKEILNMVAGHISSAYYGYGHGDLRHVVDPTTRAWFKKAKVTKGVYYTDAYVDAITGATVVSAVGAYYDDNGNFAGAVCDDVSLATLGNRAKEINYRGSGIGYIVESTGIVLAAGDDTKGMSKVETLKWGGHFKEMVAAKEG